MYLIPCHLNIEFRKCKQINTKLSKSVYNQLFTISRVAFCGGATVPKSSGTSTRFLQEGQIASACP